MNATMVGQIEKLRKWYCLQYHDRYSKCYKGPNGILGDINGLLYIWGFPCGEHIISGFLGYCACSVVVGYQPWRWRQHSLPKYFYPTPKLNGVTTQKSTNSALAEPNHSLERKQGKISDPIIMVHPSNFSSIILHTGRDWKTMEIECMKTMTKEHKGKLERGFWWRCRHQIVDCINVRYPSFLLTEHVYDWLYAILLQNILFVGILYSLKFGMCAM